jgi:hypothetical protein
MSFAEGVARGVGIASEHAARRKASKKRMAFFMAASVPIIYQSNPYHVAGKPGNANCADERIARIKLFICVISPCAVFVYNTISKSNAAMDTLQV